MITPQGEEVILFLLQPTNVSVLSREGLRARVNALMNVLKGFAEVELLCLNSRESFEHNKQYLTRRIEQEPVPQIRTLLEQDLRLPGNLCWSSVPGTSGNGKCTLTCPGWKR